MPWVEFTKDYDEFVNDRHVRQHKAGSKAIVREATAVAVEEAGAGKRTRRDKAEEKAQEKVEEKNSKDDGRAGS